MIAVFNQVAYITSCDIANAAGALISGSFMYLIYSVFFTLSIFKKNITVSIHVSTSTLASTNA